MNIRRRNLIVISLIATGLVVALIWLGMGSTSYTKTDRVKVRLVAIAENIRLYIKEKNTFNTSSGTLLNLVEKGYLPKETLIDPWSQDIRYECLDAACKEILIYSFGQNKINEHGKGDDISVTIKF